MVKGSEKTIAGLAFEMTSQNPYRCTYDDVLFSVYAKRNDLVASELPKARQSFFAKGQPGLRTSALEKRKLVYLSR